ncbi:MAG: cupin domain-containing protein [Bacillota bacterium]
MKNSLDLKNIFQALEDAQWDQAVGIKIVKLTGNDVFAFYAAQIDGHKRVGAHYHIDGIEVYQIIAGQGSIYIGSPQDGGDVKWKQAVSVKTGDCFTVNPGEAHQLVNTAGESLILVFACPFSHVSSDRIMVTGV